MITPYAGFSVFVAAHINMYGTVSPHPYPGGRERAETEKKANFAYLERVCKFWPGVGRSWVCFATPLREIHTNETSGAPYKKRTDSTKTPGITLGTSWPSPGRGI